jgi:menaquinone-9 beta-reductase
VSRLDDDNFIELHFLKHLLPGYFWIFPLPDGSANVGLGMRSDKVSKKKINLKKELLNIINHHPEIKKRFQFAVPQDEIRGFGLPLGSKKRNISGSNYLLTGDAASLIDPFTGEGIGNAMLSGIIAARHTVECFAENNFSAPFNKKYDAAVYDRLSNELNLSRTMQQLATFPRLFNFVVNKAAHNQTLKQTISAMFENISLRHKLSQPSFYINLLLK